MEAEERACAEEAAKKAAEEAAAAEAAAEARKLRQIEKKATQKERSRLRSLCSGMGTLLLLLLCLWNCAETAGLLSSPDEILCERRGRGALIIY